MTKTPTTRRGNWKQTHCGVAFWPLDPRPDEVQIEDIAHALACVNRYGGHAPEPYSVAQHSLLVSERAVAIGTQLAGQLSPETSQTIARWGLLHDAAEAYVGDMVQPLKHTDQMAPFRAAEAQVMRVIAARFGLPVPSSLFAALEPAEVRLADADLLLTEARDFFPEESRPMPWGVKGAVLPFKVVPMPWREAKARFLERFKQLWPDEEVQLPTDDLPLILVDHPFARNPWGKDVCDARVDEGGSVRCCARPAKEHRQ